MKLKNVALTLSLAGFGLLASGGKATAATFTVPGYGTYNITTLSTTFNDSSTLLSSQPWFGSAAAAQTFTNTVGGGLGFPNFGVGGPFFGYTSNVNFFYYTSSSNSVVSSISQPFSGFAYATVTSAVVPEPSEVIGTLLFGVISASYLLKRQGRKVA